MKFFLFKVIAFSFYFLLSTFYLHSQVPQKFNYQGIARDAKGNPMAKQMLALKLSVLPTLDALFSEYEEVQTVITNDFGLYSLQIGNGTPIKGEMKTVKWETGNKYIKVMIDPTGGSNFLDAGTTQLLSVPYAIYADKAGVAKTAANTDRAGSVSTSASGTGTMNFLTKFTAANTIYNSQLFDNGTNIGIGTTTPVAKIHINQNIASVQEHFRMQNLSATGAGRFTLYSNSTTNYATFTKYGSSFAGSYAGLTGLYPYANLLAFGNNGLVANDGLGRFLISTAGNAGISIFKGGTSKLKFHADFTTENVGIGGNASPISRLHLSNTDGTTMDVRLTNNTSGHSATDGLVLMEIGNEGSLINRENGNLQLGTNNISNLIIVPSGNVELSNQIKIAGGNPGTGKVLTSDTAGLASWELQPISWKIDGNANTNQANNFIGTIDAQSLNFRVNNKLSGRIDSSQSISFFGFRAGGNSFSNSNSAFGYKSLFSNVTGNQNVAVGVEALFMNVSGGSNVAIGNGSLKNIVSGVSNTAIGNNALYELKSGAYNTALGFDALKMDTLSNYNTAVGSLSIYYNINGVSNTAIGHSSLINNSTGSSNVAVGISALSGNIGGSSNTAIGENSFSNGGFFNNSTALGAFANITASNQVRIGSASVYSIGGQVGWSTLSDLRLKNNINPIKLGLNFILDLNPVTYSYISDKNNTIYSGFLAQEVEAAAQQYGVKFSGVDAPKNENDFYSLRYAEFTVPLVKSVQELNGEIDLLKKQNQILQQQIDELKVLLKK
jgi:hypothetical protein